VNRSRREKEGGLYTPHLRILHPLSSLLSPPTAPPHHAHQFSSLPYISNPRSPKTELLTLSPQQTINPIPRCFYSTTATIAATWLLLLKLLMGLEAPKNVEISLRVWRLEGRKKEVYIPPRSTSPHSTPTLPYPITTYCSSSPPSLTAPPHHAHHPNHAHHVHHLNPICHENDL
jgi:hypothetical protein